METVIRFRHNAMHIHSLAAFGGIKGGMNQNCKDVYFVRLLGVNATILEDIRQMDASMAARMSGGQTLYRRILSLPKIQDPAIAANYESCYQAWISEQKEKALTKAFKNDAQYAGMLGGGLQKVFGLYAADRPVSASMEKNFIIKMLYWHDFLLADLFAQWSSRMSVKLVLANIVKKQEYLFAYLLTLLGYDVLLLQTEADISGQEEAWGFSQKIKLGEFQKIDLPPFSASDPGARRMPTPAAASRPARPIVQAQGGAGSKTSAASSQRPVVTIPPRTQTAHPRTVQEKSFEQLAQLARSVVLIAIHDRNGDVVGTGSGIMIGAGGYILTNSHVASGGAFYSIRIEDDETVYSTDELIKYHSVLDLAILRIERRLKPLPIYHGEKPLARGQKVVAIGSPLGLFNSVSDGIISGFRKMDGVDMIQFTAPISHGSSGGAVLNMYGEVIGISTAGFDSGQNINLAVGYACISQFVQGFV